jgi:phosphoribosylformylglycinamidine cyclo-ligase
MAKSYSDRYKEAGVDITAGYRSVDLIKKYVNATKCFGKTSDVGDFGGLFSLDVKNMEKPTLVSGTDGVGTKLKLAFLTGKHDTVGIDCVAMCVNDIICSGAKPLFFLDYIACGKNIPEKIAEIVKGVSDGCIQSEMVLIGGETAEMPGFYKEDEYDLAGFAVGMVDEKDIPKKSAIKEGDAIIALPSSGIHSNGFSLVRRVFDVENKDLGIRVDELGKTLGEALLEPTLIYVKPVLKLLQNVKVKSIANITGGGFYENIPRSLPEGMSALIEKKNIRRLPIFDLIQKTGDIPEHDMYNTFNMGVGMIITLSGEDFDRSVEILKKEGVDAYFLGETVRSPEGVILCE